MFHFAHIVLCIVANLPTWTIIFRNENKQTHLVGFSFGLKRHHWTDIRSGCYSLNLVIAGLFLLAMTLMVSAVSLNQLDSNCIG